MNKTTYQKVEQYFKKYPEVIVAAGTILIEDDDKNPPIYFIKSGHIEQYDITPQGKKILLTVYKSPAFFPLLPSIGKKSNTYFFAAQTNSTLHRAPSNDVVIFLKDNPDIMFNLLSRLYRGVDGLLLRLNTLLSGSASERIMTELRIMYDRFTPKDSVIFVSEKQLAEQTGLARETVSRELQKLKKNRKILLEKGKITLLQ